MKKNIIICIKIFVEFSSKIFINISPKYKKDIIISMQWKTTKFLSKIFFWWIILFLDIMKIKPNIYDISCKINNLNPHDTVKQHVKIINNKKLYFGSEYKMLKGNTEESDK